MRVLDVRPSFDHDLGHLARQHVAVEWDSLAYIFDEVIAGRDVPEMLRPHPLHLDWAGWWDFHLGPDLVVIYRLTPDAAIFKRIGTHKRVFAQRLKSIRARTRPL